MDREASMASESDGDTGRPAGDTEVADGALPALPVIQRFGGIRPMAQKLGVPVSTVQGWKERGAIPANRREEVLAAAAGHNIAMEPGDLTVAATPPVIELPGARPAAEPASPTATTEATASKTPPATAVREPSPWSRVESKLADTAEDASEAKGPPVRETAMAAAPAPARSSLIPAVLASALVALLISGTAPYWTRALGVILPAGPAVDTGLSDQVRALDRRIAELESRPATVAGTGTDPELIGRIEALEQLNDQLRGDLDRLAASAGAAAAGGAPAPALAGRLEAVSDEVASLKNQIEAIRRDSSQVVAPERLAALFDRIEENAAELRAMQGKLSGLVELPKRVEELSLTIEAASGQTRRSAFVLASGQLEAALDSGQPYASELGAVRRLAADDPELPVLLARLEQHSDEGIPTMAELRVRFDDTALAVAQAAQSNVDGGWIDRAWARLRSLVTVRPVGGDVAGDSPEAHLARAEARLDEGDLASAVGELEALEGAAAETAAPWLAGARARVAADEAIERLRARALARIAPDGAIE